MAFSVFRPTQPLQTLERLYYFASSSCGAEIGDLNHGIAHPGLSGNHVLGGQNSQDIFSLGHHEMFDFVPEHEFVGFTSLNILVQG